MMYTAASISYNERHVRNGMSIPQSFSWNQPATALDTATGHIIYVKKQTKINVALDPLSFFSKN